MSNKREVFVSVDVEAAGPVPGEFSLLSIGACSIYEPEKTFACELKPTSQNFDPKALEVSGFSLDQLTQNGLAPSDAMRAFADWLSTIARRNEMPVFVGFNAPFDWSFVNYYFHRFYGSNPFGFTALDIKALYMGATSCRWGDTRSSKIAERLKPVLSGTHDALRDALYQAEMFRLIRSELMDRG
ncbi:DNA polymerase III epsilon subunit-like protein [Bradyrhizobium sp. USDA 4354]